MRFSIFTLIMLGIFLLGCTPATDQAVVTSFEECVAEGNPVMDSYPQQCRSADGQLFVAEIDEELLPPEGVDVEEGIACTMDAMECPDGSFVGRVPPSCEFAPCPGE